MENKMSGVNLRSKNAKAFLLYDLNGWKETKFMGFWFAPTASAA